MAVVLVAARAALGRRNTAVVVMAFQNPENPTTFRSIIDRSFLVHFSKRAKTTARSRPRRPTSPLALHRKLPFSTPTCEQHRSFHGTLLLASSDNGAGSSSSSATTKVAGPSTDQELLELKRLYEEASSLCEKNIASTKPIHELKEALADLAKEQSDPGFWEEGNADRANQVNAQFSTFSRLLARLEQWQQWQGDAQAALEMIALSDSSSSNSNAGGGDTTTLSQDEREMLLDEFREASTRLLEDSKRYELDLLLSGPYDQSPARIILTAGAGGTEANDWVADLKRMYERYCENTRAGFTCVTEDYQEGDVVGYKSVDMLITGPNAYGWFQGEKGAHRLVRLSPFNANNKRQTTFAGVDVAPADVMDDSLLQNFELDEKELEITSMRSGGKGGQNVNKVETAVRIKHLPSGLQVKCSQERSQPRNREIALRRLKAQLLAVAREQRVQRVAQIRGDAVEASWGAQIRNYVLHPYKMVKDPRTGWETSNAPAFLDGDEAVLDDCIGAYLRHKAKQDQEEEKESGQ